MPARPGSASSHRWRTFASSSPSGLLG
jgi:hypothetical protein